MLLPKISQPIFTLDLPSNNKTISCRPYLVKEDKILLMAAATEKAEDITQAVRQIVNNCILDEDINVDALPTFDIDWVFIHLRARSVGDTRDIPFLCNNEIDGNTCGSELIVTININDIKIIRDEKVKDTEIMLSDKIGAKLKYPSFSTLQSIKDSDDDTQKTNKLIRGSIDYLFEGDKKYPMKDVSPEEFNEFLDSLSLDQFEQLEYFINNLPHFEIKSNMECNACGFNHEFTFNQLQSFF
jgi:hypothetical protein